MYITEITGPTICTHGCLVGKTLIHVVLSANCPNNPSTACKRGITMSVSDIENHIVELGKDIPEYSIYISSDDHECLAQQKELNELLNRLDKNKETYNRTVCIETRGMYKPTTDLLSQYNLFWSIVATPNSKFENLREIITSAQFYELVFELTKNKKVSLSEGKIKDLVYKLSMLDLTINNNIFLASSINSSDSLDMLSESIEICIRNGWNLYPTLPYDDHTIQKTIQLAKVH